MLTEKMNEYRVAQERANALKAEIEEEIILIEKSVQSQGVKATFRKVAKKVDYEKAACSLGIDTEPFTTPKVDYTSAVKNAVKSGAVPKDKLSDFTTSSAPSVSIKLV